MNEKDAEAQTEFLLAAIEDARDVIRAIDTKVAALFFGLSIPLSKLNSIWAISQSGLERTSGIAHLAVAVLIALFSLAWLVSLYASLQTLLHIDDPSAHVAGEKPTGIFYSAGIFRASWRDALFSRRQSVRVEFSRFFGALPSTQEAARKELAFELLKLVYVRTLKMKRASVAYYSFYLWLVSGGLIWAVQLGL